MRAIWASCLSVVGIVSASLAIGQEWTQLFPTGDPPAPRVFPSLVYDALRDRGLMFGGQNCSQVSFNDVWSLSLADPPTWSLVSTTGTPPTPREAAAAVYDPIRDRMVLFGGADESTRYNEVWALSLSDPPMWQELSAAGPSPAGRERATMIYDPVDDRLVVFGGTGEDRCTLGDTWAFSLETHTWQLLAASGAQPGARNTTGGYDSIAHRMLIYGGRTAVFAECGPFEEYTDTWQLSLSGEPTWSLIPTTDPHPAPIQAVSAYDPVNHAMWLSGGWACCGDNYDDTYFLALDGEPVWVLVPDVGVPTDSGGPWQIQEVYDSERHRILAMQRTNCSLNQVWFLPLPDTRCNFSDNDGDGLSECDGDCDDTNSDTYPGAPEICDGEDNQCQGDVGHGDYDEGFPLLGTQCTAGIGACEASGVIACTADGLGAECDAVPGTPTPEICDGIDNDCNGSADFPGETTDQDTDNVLLCNDCDDTNPNCSTDCVDADGDDFCVPADCDDANANTYPGATEINDGEDNNCPGDMGYGVIDEVAGFEFGDPTMICWPAQAGATQYELARSDDPTFALNCTLTSTASTCVTDTDEPPEGSVFNYLVRSRAPFVGSWGQDSSGAERTNVCP